MGQAYNISAAVGRVSTYVTAVLTTIIAIICVFMGTKLIRAGEPTGIVVQGKVTAVTPGCAELFGKACTVTATYSIEGKEYTSVFPSMTVSYAVGDLVPIRIANLQYPEQAEENFPKRTVGWVLLVAAVLGVCITVSLYNFASESKNFAAGAGILTFIQALLGLF
jgi:hypothetical protein